jgi:hypothetical protein
LDRVLVAGSQATAHFAFAFLPTGQVYSSNLTVIAVNTYSAFAAIQSRIHEVWSRFFMTTLGDTLVYTPTTCFEHFPFPDGWEMLPSLEIIGRSYYEGRSALMIDRNEGLTEIYNRFHDPSEESADIVQLRKLHAEMDLAVAAAYGWKDLELTYEFSLEYEEDSEDSSGSGRKKPWRYRWPQAIRDEVMSRLLKLNEQKYKQQGSSSSRNSENRIQGEL